MTLQEINKEIKRINAHLEELEPLAAHNEGAGYEQEIHALWSRLDELWKLGAEIQEELERYNNAQYGDGHW